ncbi:MAG: D-sedoheptulose 7-phosphate isomerase [Candidatus Omnitrophica bacterium]|nr:D-sedoheptulose 7-phosphate isomerase [Candidatus Omnitrophota bacterium]
MSWRRFSLVNAAAFIEAGLSESIETKTQVLKNLVPAIGRVAELWIRTLEAGGKILLFGNGGSASDSQHIAAELVGKLKVKRRALPALALTTDTSALTAIANDFSFEQIFERQVEALGSPGDAAVGISTSGSSANVLAAIRRAKAMGLTTVAFTGRGGGDLAKLADEAIVIPSDSTQRIQESHITIAHILCELVEARFSGS